jgi:uncharacterized protein
MSSYKLHPHHGLCIAFFEGKGYSSEFIDHMTALIKTLSESSLVQMTFCKDIICTKCPNIREHQCINQEKVLRFDKAVLAACNLHVSQMLKWGDFRNTVYRQIILKDKLRSVCGDCQWKTICQDKADEIATKKKLP